MLLAPHRRFRIACATAAFALSPLRVLAGQPSAAPAGAVVKAYKLGKAVRQLPELKPGQSPNVVSVQEQINFRAPHEAFGDLHDNFYTEVDAWLEISEAGRYEFTLLSDDGGQLYLDDRLVIDHDGLHGPTPVSAAVELERGRTRLFIRHFEAGGGEQLTLRWKPPGAEVSALVPGDHLRHEPSWIVNTTPGEKAFVPALRRGRSGDGTPPPIEHEGFEEAGSAEAAKQVAVGRRIGAARGPRGIMVRAFAPEKRGETGMLRYLHFPQERDFENLLCWIPAQTALRDPSIPGLITTGVYDQQYVIADRKNGTLHRVSLDWFADQDAQGCVFRMTGPAGRGVDLVSIDSRAGGFFLAPTGRDTIIHYVPRKDVPFEPLRVEAMSNGLRVTFTQPLDPRVGWEPDSYYVEQWPYGDGAAAPQRTGERTPVKSASVAYDRRSVFLEMPDLRPDHLVYLRLLPPCLSEQGEMLRITECFLTLRTLPDDRRGAVRQRPPQAPQNTLTDEERAAGWTLLFDGESTDRWRGWKRDSFPDRGWVVRDACLVHLAQGGGGDIITVNEYEDFELKLEWRISQDGNSGIFYRVAERPEFDAVWRTGPEMQILDNRGHADGGNPKTSAGANYALHAPREDVTRPVGLFNEARILVNGNHVEHWLNGVKIVEYQLLSPEWRQRVANSKFADMPHYGRMKRGHIALQDHSDQVWFRNIKIRRLPSQD